MIYVTLQKKLLFDKKITKIHRTWASTNPKRLYFICDLQFEIENWQFEIGIFKLEMWKKSGNFGGKFGNFKNIWKFGKKWKLGKIVNLEKCKNFETILNF